ncbi:uroporphyrinogen-III C-methyltransferase [Paludifilum halophilum]|uniref:Uroporphyrinogen-III C-methyltransferase n=1 Tax=Paludifilum halophilum TaxID=1642702 RepID=A0A235B9A3_9BACL|nr:uroporphyrinogen-III C-methyltransferase [Paludifilum halophilum]OYD08812.1 uroporphyrinogen-III C-methyltransferase [Paludifilum halophilum]
MKDGRVYIVGAGPGDPELITVKGLKALRRADVLLYDRLVHPRLLSQTSEHCEKIDVGKRADRHRMTQDAINEMLVKKAREQKRVVRLKGGDPFVFGRGGEEAAVLKSRGIPYEVIPGIPSATAVPAYAGIPVTHRDYSSSFIVVTGHERRDKKEPRVKWKDLAQAAETLVILMGVKHLSRICDQLLRHGRRPETPVALIRWGSRREQETWTGTLADIAHGEESVRWKAPAVIVVGEVVRMREAIAWYEQQFGAHPEEDRSVTVFEDHGAVPGFGWKGDEIGLPAVENVHDPLLPGKRVKG